MSTEDDLIETLIHQHKSDGNFDNDTNHNFEVEAHYNHYGDRGVADLFVREFKHIDGEDFSKFDYIYEVKSESAVKEATGANSVIRQFNRMRNYFYKDDSHSIPDDYIFELCFIPTLHTVKHVADNLSLYQSLFEKNLGPELNNAHSSRIEARVLFRLPDEVEFGQAKLLASIERADSPTHLKEELLVVGSEPPNSSTVDQVISYLDRLGY